MTTDPTTSLRPAARAASHPDAVVEGPGFGTTLAAPALAPTFGRAATGAVAASVKASRVPSKPELLGRPRAAARAASSVARG